MSRRLRLFAVTTISALSCTALWGCDPLPKSGAAPVDKTKVALGDTPLYERLGGEPGITMVVEDFVARGAANPNVNFTRRGTPRAWQPTPENMDHLKKMLVVFICQASGGPHKYKGRDMKSVHAGMRITDAEFDALAGDLKASLDKHRVPQREQDDLMALVGSTRKDIVE